MSVERTQTVFDYVNRTGIRMMPFIRVPKFLLEEPLFRIVSVDAVLLYSILLDRLELSLANDWFDEHGHAYVIYTIKEIQKVMRCGHDKAIRMLRELDTEHGIGRQPDPQKEEGELMDRPVRKPIRLKNYDYSAPGAYCSLISPSFMT